MSEPEQYSFHHLPGYVIDLSRCWENVVHLGERIELKKGDTFTMDTERRFSYIRKGYTCCYVRNSIGKKDEIRFFVGEGCLVKETFFAGNYKYGTYHKCLSDVIMYSFDGNMIYEQSFMQRHGDLIRNYIYSISIKSISSQLFSSLLKQKDNFQKIAYYLYGFWVLNGGKSEFHPPMSQIQLGEFLGISAQTINRIIGSWKDDGILGAYTKNNLVILDVDLLREKKGIDII